jgi:hypothetical protein
MPRERAHRRKQDKSPPRTITNLKIKKPRKETKNMSTVTLTWTDVTTLVDGTPLPAGFTVELFDTASATPTVALGSVAAGIQTYTTGVLTPGDHSFTAVTVDANGVSSAPSNAVTVTVPTPVDASAPAAITNLVATLNS